MGNFQFNYDFLKNNATSGSWRRGYEYYQKDMILEAYPEKNFFKGKVKGNYQEFYVTDLIFKKNKIEARCNCPLKEEWCKHAVAIGLKAMEELNKLNHGSHRASTDMCTFLIINISSLQLIPVNIIAYRSQYGSVTPTSIIGMGLIATLISTAAGVIFAVIARHFGKGKGAGK